MSPNGFLDDTLPSMQGNTGEFALRHLLGQGRVGRFSGHSASIDAIAATESSKSRVSKARCTRVARTDYSVDVLRHDSWQGRYMKARQRRDASFPGTDELSPANSYRRAERPRLSQPVCEPRESSKLVE